MIRNSMTILRIQAREWLIETNYHRLLASVNLAGELSAVTHHEIICYLTMGYKLCDYYAGSTWSTHDTLELRQTTSVTLIVWNAGAFDVSLEYEGENIPLMSAHLDNDGELEVDWIRGNKDG